MVSHEPKFKRRLLSPATVLILACLGSLIAGIYYGQGLAVSHSASRRSSMTLQPGPGAKAGVQNLEQAAAQEPPSPICLNTCPKANDGVCDDGRGSSGADALTRRTVLCDLGTDCADCGPWTPSTHVSWGSPSTQGPIALLTARGIPVFVKNSTTSPSFAFAYTDPKQDYDVSSFFDASGMIEASITHIFYHIFRAGCLAGGAPAAQAATAGMSRTLRAAADPASKAGMTVPQTRALFVDVGANFGWFSLLAAALGCRVTAFEPVPHFHAFFEYSTHLNGFAPLVRMRRELVSNESGVKLDLIAPSKGIWGTAGIGGLNIDPAIRSSTNTKLKVPSVRLEDVVKQDVLLLKVDVEGWEWSVMQGARQLLASHHVENVIMEYSPGVPERHARHADLQATVQMLVNLGKASYRIGHIGEMGKHEQVDPGAPLPQLEEITLQNLAYDEQDAAAFAAQQLGCPIAQELRRFQGWQLPCGISLPEDVSPFSLRSMISHNTNVWAAKGGSLLKLEGTVGILKLSADPKQYFVEKGEIFGMGSRICKDIAPPVQVRHRCPCTNASVCGEEAQVVQRLASEGKITTNYRLPPASL